MRAKTDGSRRWTVSGRGRWVATIMVAIAAANPRVAHAIPAFARIYDKPCGACHTVFPQLNPAGERFRAQGLHGLEPAAPPLHVGAGLEVPATLPLALYLASGLNVVAPDEPQHANDVHAHVNLDFLRVLGGGELGPHLGFLFDHEMLEMEPESGQVVVNTMPYQAYLVAHLEHAGWLANLKGGWYELPLDVSPSIHRLSVRSYRTYDATGCDLLGAEPRGGRCSDVPTLGSTQLGAEVSGLHAERGLAWAVGFTNGSDNRVDDAASKDVYVRLSQLIGTHRVGGYLAYSPDVIGHGVDDETVRFGPDLDIYSRRFRLLGQLLVTHESNPTGYHRGLWHYGAFLEGQYRLTKELLALLRVEPVWTQSFDDRSAGGTTHARRRIVEVTAGWQWLLLENVRLLAEVTYARDEQTLSDETSNEWTGTLRLATAFWPLAPPFLWPTQPGGRR